MTDQDFEEPKKPIQLLLPGFNYLVPKPRPPFPQPYNSDEEETQPLPTEETPDESIQ